MSGNATKYCTNRLKNCSIWEYFYLTGWWWLFCSMRNVYNVHSTERDAFQMKKKENVGIFPTMSSSMSAKLFQHKIYAIEHLSNISSKSATTLQTTNTKNALQLSGLFIQRYPCARNLLHLEEAELILPGTNLAANKWQCIWSSSHWEISNTRKANKRHCISSLALRLGSLLIFLER